MISFAEGRGDEERERKKGGDEQGYVARGMVNDSRQVSGLNISVKGGRLLEGGDKPFDECFGLFPSNFDTHKGNILGKNPLPITTL